MKILNLFTSLLFIALSIALTAIKAALVASVFAGFIMLIKWLLSLMSVCGAPEWEEFMYCATWVFIIPMAFASVKELFFRFLEHKADNP